MLRHFDRNQFSDKAFKKATYPGEFAGYYPITDSKTIFYDAIQGREVQVLKTDLGSSIILDFDSLRYSFLNVPKFEEVRLEGFVVFEKSRPIGVYLNYRSDLGKILQCIHNVDSISAMFGNPNMREVFDDSVKNAFVEQFKGK